MNPLIPRHLHRISQSSLHNGTGVLFPDRRPQEVFLIPDGDDEEVGSRVSVAVEVDDESVAWHQFGGVDVVPEHHCQGGSGEAWGELKLKL